MILVVGLGNPGREYAASKHNVGFIVLDRLSQRLGFSITKKGFKSLFGEAVVSGTRVMFLKPQTYMNLSGGAVAEAAGFFKIATEDIIAVYDEMDLSIGAVRIKFGGGSAGHKGVESIKAHLSDDKFVRVRVGIGKPIEREATTSHVLSGFAKDEREIIADAVERAADAALEIIQNGREAAMNKFNQKQDALPK